MTPQEQDLFKAVMSNIRFNVKEGMTKQEAYNDECGDWNSYIYPHVNIEAVKDAVRTKLKL